MDIKNITKVNGFSLKKDLDPAEKSKVDLEVDRINKEINAGKVSSKELGKDDFLKILVSQLQNQDPSQPMEDKEMIAQMAQMSSLEQMNNLRGDFKSLAGAINSTVADSLLGKSVELKSEAGSVKGVVEEIVKGDFPQVLVNGKYFDYKDVQKIIKEED